MFIDSELIPLMGEYCYQNDSSKMVIVKCIGERHFFCEKVVMPFEFYVFEAPDDARLEVWYLKGGQPMLHSTEEVREYALGTSLKE